MGQHTKESRDQHGIAYDPARDEIFVVAMVAGAVEAFAGGADGDAPPLRIIQGPKTQLHNPWDPAVDDVHHELGIADLEGKSALVFAIDANGNVPPLRVIKGRNTGFYRPAALTIDPENNLIIVSTTTPYGRNSWQKDAGLFIFSRTANGNVKPLRVIAGPRTGINSAWHLATYHGKIYVAVSNTHYLPPYLTNGYAPRPGVKDCPTSPFLVSDDAGFIGVWNETDDGDVPPRAVIRGALSELVGPGGLAINPEAGELYATDGKRNGIFSYLVPELFRMQ
jgi:hypothetical protein